MSRRPPAASPCDKHHSDSDDGDDGAVGQDEIRTRRRRIAHILALGAVRAARAPVSDRGKDRIVWDSSA